MNKKFYSEKLLYLNFIFYKIKISAQLLYYYEDILAYLIEFKVNFIIFL